MLLYYRLGSIEYFTSYVYKLRYYSIHNGPYYIFYLRKDHFFLWQTWLLCDCWLLYHSPGLKDSHSLCLELWWQEAMEDGVDFPRLQSYVRHLLLTLHQLTGLKQHAT